MLLELSVLFVPIYAIITPINNKQSLKIMKQNSQNSQKTPKPSKPLDLITVAQDADGVMCDGGGGPLGHPNVWYSFDGRDNAACHYCGRRFVKN